MTFYGAPEDPKAAVNKFEFPLTNTRYPILSFNRSFNSTTEFGCFGHQKQWEVQQRKSSG